MYGGGKGWCGPPEGGPHHYCRSTRLVLGTRAVSSSRSSRSIEVGEQAHGGEHAGGAVAAVGFHEVWRFVGVQELAAVLRDLGERLSFEVDLDAGLFFEGLGRATPSLGLACVVLFVVPERQAVRLFLVLLVRYDQLR